MSGDPIEVSVIMPAYRARAFIPRAIDSALAQSVDGLEVLIVDDASDDSTAEFVQDCYRTRPEVRVISLTRNGGPARARNIGIEAARGEWIAILDADDAWHPERLARMMVHADQADVIFDNIAEVDPTSLTVGDTMFPEFPPHSITPCDMIAMYAPGSDFNFGYLKPIIRRRFLQEHAIVYDESLRTSEDLLFYLTLLLEGARNRTIGEALYLYTRSDAAGSPMSHTRPRDLDVREALRDLRYTYRDGLDSITATRMARRIDRFERIAPISDFYYARRRRNYAKMATLFMGHGSVQREVVTKIASRLSRVR
jgi:succinoglycan biosynthesis protein ExoO